MDIMRHRSEPIRRDPFSEMNRLLASAWGGSRADQSAVETSQWVPAVDIRDEPERFVVAVDVPGVEPGDIEVTMDNGVLSIRGERKVEQTAEESGVTRVERSYGVFYRRFALPDTADAENITAKGKNGVLEIGIGKRETAKARRIPIEGHTALEG